MASAAEKDLAATLCRVQIWTYWLEYFACQDDPAEPLNSDDAEHLRKGCLEIVGDMREWIEAHAPTVEGVG